MQIILLQDIEKVGQKHTIVTVSDGYGSNYLIPQGMALIANEHNRGQLSTLQRREGAQEAKLLADYQIIADKLKSAVLRIGAKVGTSGKIFGSVTNVQLATAIKEQMDIDIDRRKIHLPEDVKEVGTYEAVIDLHKAIDSKVKFEVVGE